VSVVGGRSYSRDKSPILALGEEKPTMVVVAEQGAPSSVFVYSVEVSPECRNGMVRRSGRHMDMPTLLDSHVIS